ncbi:hypothetical protein ACF3M1_10905 [Luteimonas sp. WGS1318]|uniref:hypothetical protein n=1 Tax=Luteimonas sp. WGS1318 TaxID=3366815 RepID=UPI00372D7306
MLIHLPFLLTIVKRNELGRDSGRKPLTHLSSLTVKEIKSFRSPRASGSLFFVGPKKSNQKKGPSPTKHIRRVVRSGIFRLAILARSKNAAHPWAAPSGSGGTDVASGFSEKRNRRREGNITSLRGSRHSDNSNLRPHIA